ncbi:hypothetical protein Drose_15660 [Dactylosporangium roseum]|uniref:Uncharacterized protein n=1 Tax=Dactylosporangium roseum TaxID=47989 RepID=A0ABY5ZF06_9ACTN|nr:hypothetical protein [Dactylosporangium roseum]UWZ39540.1 hypothetical protein Drose_15660 [Dactylosporangium roseum]
MSIGTLNGYESEDFDQEAEDFDSDETRTEAERRRRARQIAAARRRMAQGRPRPLTPTAAGRPPTPRETVAAIRNLDLETKVGEDSLRRALDQANRRASRATYVAVGSVAVDQALDTFRADLESHDILRAALRFAPLLLLSPQRTRPGLEGYLLDPRVLGGAAVAGIAAVGAFRKRGTAVDHIKINQPKLAGGQRGKFLGLAFDGKGREVAATIRWRSSTPQFLEVQDDGSFEVPKLSDEQTVLVTAEADGRRESIFVTVPRDDGIGNPSAGRS